MDEDALLSFPVFAFLVLVLPPSPNNSLNHLHQLANFPSFASHTQRKALSPPQRRVLFLAPISTMRVDSLDIFVRACVKETLCVPNPKRIFVLAEREE